MPDISIAIKAQDRFSDAMKTMADSSQAFSKDVDGLQEKLDALNRTRAVLKIDTDKARSDLREAEKQFQKTGTESDKLAMQDKKLTFETARRNLSMVGKEAGNAERSMLKMGDAFSKTENRAGGIMGNLSTLAKGLATAGLGKMVGDTMQQTAGWAISSGFNSSTGNVLSKALGNAISGAAMGAMINPAAAVAGGAIGAVTGAVSGAVTNASAKDDAMRQYASETEQTAIQNSKTRAATSSDTASQREQDRLAFTTLMGSKKNAKSLLSGVNSMANHTPYVYDDLTGIARTLNVYGDTNQKSILSHLKTIGNTGSALKLSTSDMDSVAQILGFMGSSPKLDSVLLKQLRRKGINANQMLASSYGVSSDQFSSMVSSGKISGADAMNRLYDALSKKFAGMMDKQSKTFEGLQSTIVGLKQNLENSQGEAYNKTVKKSQQSEIDMMQGPVGKEMAKMYSMIGTGKGIQQNREQKIKEDVATGVLMGGKIKNSDIDKKSMAEIKKLNKAYQAAQKEYQKGTQSQKMEAGAKMDAIKQKMDVLSTGIIDASTAFDSIDKSDESVAKYSQEISSILHAYADKWTLNQVRSKGILSYLTGSGGAALSLTKTGAGDYFNTISDATGKKSKKKAKKHAVGLDYVPYDNFPALLHEGERVQTAVEARSERSGGRPVIIQGNNFTIREQADIHRVASSLLKQMQLAEERG